MEKAAVSQAIRDGVVPEIRNDRLRRMPILVFVIGFTLSLFFALLTRHWEQNLIQAEFQLYANNHLSMIQRKIDRHLEGVASVAGLYKASLLVSRDEFSAFTANLLGYHDDIQALEWVPKVGHTERDIFEQSAHESGLLDFLIVEKSVQGKMVRASERSEHYPVYYAEPYQDNEHRLGYDLGSDPSRLKELQQARDAGELVVSEPFAFPDGAESQYVSLLIKPVYQNGKTSNTVEQRRDNLIGFVLGMINLGDMLEQAIASQSNLGLDFIFQNKGEALYFHSSSSRSMPISQRDIEGNDSAIYWQSPINVPGAQWSIRFSPAPEFYGKYTIWRTWVVLIIAVLLTLLLMAFLRVSAIRSTQTEALAGRLANSNRQLETEVSMRRQLENSIRHVASGVSVSTGERFFHSLLEHLTDSLGMAYAHIGEISADGSKQVTTKSVWMDGRVQSNFSYELAGSPCENVMNKGTACYKANVKECFPDFQLLVDNLPKSYLGIPLLASDNMPLGLLVVVDKKPIDNPQSVITLLEIFASRAAAELERMRKEEWLQLAANISKNMHEAVMVTDADRNIIYVNPAFKKITGYRFREVVGKTPRLLSSGKHSSDFYQKMWKELLSKGEWQGEVWNRRKDGGVYVEWQSISSIQNADGKVTHYISVFSDISKRKQTELELAKAKELSEKRYRELFENSNDITLIVEITDQYMPGRFVDVNQAACTQLGYSREELLRMTPADLHAPETVDNIPSQIQKILSQGKTLCDAVYVAKDGHHIPVEVNIRLYEQNGKRMAIGAARDLSSRRKAEMALRESEERFREMAENIDEVFWMVRPDDHQLIYVSPAYEHIWGRPCGDLFSKRYDWIDAIHTDDVERVKTAFMQVAAEGYDEEYRIVRPDKSIRWIHDRAYALRNANDYVYRIIGIAQDITTRKHAQIALRSANEKLELRIIERTQALAAINESLINEIDERKKTEAELRDSREHFRYLIESANAIPWKVDLASWRFTYVGPQVERLLGYPIDDWYGESFWLDHLYPEDRDKALAFCQQATERGKNHVFEYRMVAADGRVLWLKDDVSLVKDGGKVVGLQGFMYDITNIKNNEQRIVEQLQNLQQLNDSLRKSEMSLSEAQRIAHVGNWSLDLINNKLVWSDEIFRIFEINPNMFKASYEAFLDSIHPDDRVYVDQAYTDSLKNMTPYNVEHRLLMSDGRVKYVHESCETSYDEQGRPLCSIGTVQDITERKKSEDVMRKLSSALEQTADTVMITNRDGIIEYVNQAFEDITGYLKTEVIGKRPSITRSERHDKKFYQRLWDTVLDGKVFRDVFINRRKDGSLYYEDKTITPLKQYGGEITHFIATGNDITERMLDQERLQYLAHHDLLTDLPNRVLFMDRLERALVRAQRSKLDVALMFVDLDRFKAINDTLGHDAGDVTLKTVSDRLRECVRGGDTIARLGGDEFAVLLEEIESIDDVAYIADKFLQSLSQPFQVAGQELTVTSSIGISLYPNDSDSSQTLLKHADLAMYRAKGLGRNNYQYYADEMGVSAVEHMHLEIDLRNALEREEFRLYYQPQLDLISNKVIGVEALLRWQHPQRGLLAPDEFIQLLEGSSLMINVGEWILRTACLQARHWERSGMGDLKIAVNLSSRQFQDQSLADAVSKVLKETELKPYKLELELTESSIMEHTEHTLNTFHALKMMGVKLAIDDFGTGYSSLSYLKSFPIDVIKIDRSFIEDVGVDSDEAVIVKAIIAIAENLEIDTTAEGIETESQLEFLKKNTCISGQGYLFSKPLTADEFEKWLAENDAIQ